MIEDIRNSYKCSKQWNNAEGYFLPCSNSYIFLKCKSGIISPNNSTSKHTKHLIKGFMAYYIRCSSGKDRNTIFSEYTELCLNSFKEQHPYDDLEFSTKEEWEKQTEINFYAHHFENEKEYRHKSLSALTLLDRTDKDKLMKIDKLYLNSIRPEEEIDEKLKLLLERIKVYLNSDYSWNKDKATNCQAAVAASNIRQLYGEKKLPFKRIEDIFGIKRLSKYLNEAYTTANQDKIRAIEKLFPECHEHKNIIKL